MCKDSDNYRIIVIIAQKKYNTYYFFGISLT